MKQRKERPVGLADIDPQLAELAREREAQVRQMMMLTANGGMTASTSAIAAQVAAAAQRSTTREGREAINILQANQRTDEVIRAEIKQTQRGWRKIFAGPNGALHIIFIPLILFPILLLQIIGHHSSGKHSADFLLPMLVPMMMVPMFTLLNLQNRKRKTLSPALLRVILPAVARTPGEQAYAEAAGEVCDAAQGTLGVTQAREMMKSLNSLLDNERTLAAQRESLDRAMNAQSLVAAHAERDRLQARLDATTDEAARATLRQSLELCEERLHQTQRLAPARERIDAQQEAIRQVMASLRASLAGLGVVSTGAEHLAAATSVTGAQTVALRETTTQLQGRARAAEQAVQEVATLRVSV